MKLFLSSIGIPDGYAGRLKKLVGNGHRNINIAHIIDAAEVYPLESRGFVAVQRDSFTKNGFDFKDILLKDTADPVTALTNLDVIWFGGGNVFYLINVLHQIGLRDSLLSLLDDGVVYGGSSAGAVIAGPTLKYFEKLDDPKKTSRLCCKGLGFIDFVPIPHWGNERYDERLVELETKLKNDGFKTKTISDHEAIVIG